MLLVGRVAPQGHRYHLGAVGPTHEVAPRLGEAPGWWTGRGAAELGLAGAVPTLAEGDPLGALLHAQDPRTGDVLVRHVRRDRLAGLDLIFAAPKSVSLLAGVAPGNIATVVHQGHDRSVASALEYLERHACRVRRAGDEQLDAEGLIGAAFRHRWSRAADPHLHTHVVVPNLAQGPDGRWSALYTRALFAEARAAGAVYQAVLRHELGAELGVAWGPMVNGRADIAGVPRRVVDAFSRRRATIQAWSSALAAVSAQRSLSPAQRLWAERETREPRPRLVDHATLQQEWRQRANDVGLDGQWWTSGRAMHPRSAVVPSDREVVGVDALSSEADTFSRSDIVRAWCSALPDGAEVSRIEALTDRTLGSTAVEPVATVTNDSHGAHGAGVPRRQPRYRCPELDGVFVPTQRELRLIELHGVDIFGGADADAAVTVAARLVANDRILVVAAPTPALAHRIEASTNVPAALIGAVAAGLADLDARPRRPRLACVVVDAGRVPTVALSRFLDVARGARAEVVLVGRVESHPMSLFSRLARERDPELMEVPYDDCPAMATTVTLDGGTLTLTSSATSASSCMIEDWADARRASADGRLATPAPQAIGPLLVQARAALRARGVLVGPELPARNGPFAAGDRVICIRDDRREATIIEVSPTFDDNGLRLRFDDGREEQLRRSAINSVRHAYFADPSDKRDSDVYTRSLSGRSARARTHVYVAAPRTSLSAPPSPGAFGVDPRPDRTATLIELDERVNELDARLGHVPPDLSDERRRADDRVATVSAWRSSASGGLAQAKHRRAQGLPGSEFAVSSWQGQLRAADAEWHSAQAASDAVAQRTTERDEWLGANSKLLEARQWLLGHAGLRRLALGLAAEATGHGPFSGASVGRLDSRPGDAVARAVWRDAVAELASYRERWPDTDVVRPPPGTLRHVHYRRIQAKAAEVEALALGDESRSGQRQQRHLGVTLSRS